MTEDQAKSIINQLVELIEGMVQTDEKVLETLIMTVQKCAKEPMSAPHIFLQGVDSVGQQISNSSLAAHKAVKSILATMVAGKH